MIQVSDVTGKTYDDEDMIFYRNISQIIFWLEHDCIPVDIFAGGDHKLVVAFTKEDHKRMMPLWMANKPTGGGQNG